MGQFDTIEFESWFLKQENMTEKEREAEEREASLEYQKITDDLNRGFEKGMLVKLKKIPGSDKITGFGRFTEKGWIKTAKHFQVGDEILLLSGPCWQDWHCISQDGTILYINAVYFDRDCILV